MIIRRFKKEDTNKVWNLISKTFKLIAIDFTKNGKKAFLDRQSPGTNLKRVKERDIFVAVIGNKIVGMVEGNKKDKVTRLFVDKNYQGGGIATRLMKKVEDMYRNKGATKMRVWSSSYAVKFYEKVGFRKSRGKVKHKVGVVYHPMQKILK